MHKDIMSKIDQSIATGGKGFSIEPGGRYYVIGPNYATIGWSGVPHEMGCWFESSTNQDDCGIVFDSGTFEEAYLGKYSDQGIWPSKSIFFFRNAMVMWFNGQPPEDFVGKCPEAPKEVIGEYPLERGKYYFIVGPNYSIAGECIELGPEGVVLGKGASSNRKISESDSVFDAPGVVFESGKFENAGFGQFENFKAWPGGKIGMQWDACVLAMEILRK